MGSSQQRAGLSLVGTLLTGMFFFLRCSYLKEGEARNVEGLFDAATRLSCLVCFRKLRLAHADAVMLGFGDRPGTCWLGSRHISLNRLNVLVSPASADGV
jgi:hypothetical protein